ncbi:ABC transporter substrate-binding protein [Thaumasiovibrio subtropicus]|uniref:ABC transporter substrate-binding protein n=1 Tax=Thaumasiovibrio subtropicus TaxID=1891207 RepID=UPI000B34C519|nr:ABC transporter substrate-binding protein [Thaumasiovibrio subtropicus]
MFKKGLFAIAVVLAAWLYWGNTSKTVDNSLNLSGPFEFTSQDLAKNGYLFTRLQVVESLIRIEDDAALSPQLATAWTQSDDGLTWTFTLRDNVKFHNGDTLNAAAVIDAIERARTKPGVIKHVPFDTITEQNGQVVIQLTKPYRPLLSVLAHYTMAIAAPASYHADGTIGTLYGTGPYQVTALTPPHKAHVSRFDEYWGDNATIEHVHYLAGHRSESRALLAESGQADLVYTLDPASIDNLQENPNVTVHMRSIPRTVLLKVNNEHPLLNSPEIRQAISYAIDRSGIAEHIVRVPGAEAYQLFPPALGNWHLDSYASRSRDLGKAQQLLIGQGWEKNEDGIMSRNGETFTLNLTTYSDRPELPVIATALQAQLREAGIDLQISIDNSSAIPAKHHDGTLELALVARNFGTIANPLGILLNDFARHEGSDWGPMNWSSTDMQALLKSITTEQDETAYQQQAQQIATILADEMPLIPITFYTQLVAVNQRVNNFTFDPFEINYRLSEMTLND